MLLYHYLEWIQQVKRFTSNKRFDYLLGLGLFFLIWQLIALAIGQRTMVFPGPVETIKYTVSLLGRPYTYECIGSTLLRMFMGYGLSVIVAFIFGIISGNYLFIENILSPTITAFRAIPTASLIYLFIVLAGFKMAPMYLVFMISFPIVYEGVKEGIKNVPKPIVNASRLDGADFIYDNFKIKLPLSFPYIAAALVSSFSLCFKIEIMAEVITGSSYSGLGSAIYGARSSDPTNMIPVFAYSLIAVGIMLLIDWFSLRIRKKLLSD